jgi:shikimate kinase
MPGSGKSSLGKKLAHRLGWNFTDLDEKITELGGRSPAQWLEQSGENAFRKEEARVLRLLNLEYDQIIACGGGTPCFEQNLEWMQENGMCIFIDMPLTSLAQRLSQSRGIDRRPLLQGNSDLELRLAELWQSREPYFRQISWWINGLNIDVGKLVQEIAARD